MLYIIIIHAIMQETSENKIESIYTTYVPIVSLARLDKLCWGIVIRNVEPQAMRHGGGDALAEAERVATDEISTFGERVIKGVEEIGYRWVKEVPNVL